jgi:hypothetical protein
MIGLDCIVREWIKMGPQYSRKNYREKFKTGLFWDVRRVFHPALHSLLYLSTLKMKAVFSLRSLISSRLHDMKSKNTVVYIVIVLQTSYFRTVLRLYSYITH